MLFEYVKADICENENNTALQSFHTDCFDFKVFWR